MKKRSKHLKHSIESTPHDPKYIGDIKVDKVSIKKIGYDKETIYQDEIKNLDDLYSDRNLVQWIDVTGLHDVDTIKNICEPLGIHPLTVEDVLDMTQNPKLEEYEEYIFLATKNMFLNPDDEIETEQIYFILKDNFLLTFKENTTNIFDNFTKRLIEGSNVRRYGADILLYNLLDNIVDNYFLVMSDIGSRLDDLEDELLKNPSKELLQDIYKIKRDLIYMRNILWPTRNIISNLSKNNFEGIGSNSIFYFRDVYDHIIQMIDITETYRDICSGMLDTYLSSISNKTNDVMKVLTIFSTISVPLSFLTGVYGMNFVYQPELSFRYGYLFFWFAAFLITAGMLAFFKKKKWL